VCAYGESRRDVAAKSDPPRRFVRENIAALIDRRGRFEYLALYTRLSSPLVRPKPGKFSAVPRVDRRLSQPSQPVQREVRQTGAPGARSGRRLARKQPRRGRSLGRWPEGPGSRS
jgi:hypothetical protein